MPIRFVVLGGGMQGHVIAENLVSRRDVDDVVIADIQPPRLMPHRARHVPCDALDPRDVERALQGADCVVVALPSAIARAGLANVIAAGLPTVDISFTAEPPLDLSSAAEKTGAAVVVDCGVAPGLSHILAGAAHHELGGLDELNIRVGGIPLDPPPNFTHAVYFNAEDLLAEYVRPARRRVDGKNRGGDPLDAPVEVYNDAEMGHHEAFPSDGLRSLLTSFPDVGQMVELTLRRPGHLVFMRMLRDSGFLAPSLLGSGPMGPFRKTARILSEKYPGERYPDYMLLTVEGIRGTERRAWRLVDRRQGDATAMARTTGFTAAATAIQLARGNFARPGVHPPEALGGQPALVDSILDDLRERGIDVRAERETLTAPLAPLVGLAGE